MYRWEKERTEKTKQNEMHNRKKLHTKLWFHDTTNGFEKEQKTVQKRKKIWGTAFGNILFFYSPFSIFKWISHDTRNMSTRITIAVAIARWRKKIVHKKKRKGIALSLLDFFLLFQLYRMFSSLELSRDASLFVYSSRSQALLRFIWKSRSGFVFGFTHRQQPLTLKLLKWIIKHCCQWMRKNNIRLVPRCKYVFRISIKTSPTVWQPSE